jgi:hypothetical protein
MVFNIVAPKQFGKKWIFGMKFTWSILANFKYTRNEIQKGLWFASFGPL